MMSEQPHQAVGAAVHVVPLRPELSAVSPKRRSPALAASALVSAGDGFAVLLAMFLARSWSTASTGYALATLVVLAASGRWRVHMNLRALDGAPRLVAKLAVPLLMLAPLGAVEGVPAELFRQAVITPLAVLGMRGVSYALIRSARRRKLLADDVLLVGGGEIAADLARAMTEHPELGLSPIGHLDDGPSTLPMPKLGGVADLDRILATSSASRIIVAFSTTREHELIEVLRAAVLHGIDVHIVPRFFDLAPGQRGTDVDDVWGIPLYRVRPIAFRSPAWPLKRACDIAVAAAALLVTAPVLLLAAFAVRLSGPGPVLFRQRRVGRFGSQFEVLKFRTMHVNDEADTRWGGSEDPRVTPVGRWLRRTNVDELPQLWNVLRGDMAIVGPRPERPFFAEQFGIAIPGYPARHRVPVGLTGWAQVNGLRGDTSIAERARFDNHYIEQWSLWRDIVILARTVSTVLRKGST